MSDLQRKPCRVQSEIFSSFFFFLIRKVGVMIGSADSALWVTHCRTSHTFRSDARRSVQGWRRLWCRVWKLCVRSRIVSFNNPTIRTRADCLNARRTHNSSWQILQQMKFTDFLICVCERVFIQPSIMHILNSTYSHNMSLSSQEEAQLAAHCSLPISCVCVCMCLCLCV